MEKNAKQTPADLLRQAGALELTHRVALYVPGTQGVATATDNAAQVKRVARRFCELFGGATAQQSAGYWMSERAGLVTESVTIVYAACTKAQRDAHLAQVLELAQDIKRETQQEAAAFVAARRKQRRKAHMTPWTSTGGAEHKFIVWYYI